MAIIYCFHGFGASRNCFNELEKLLSDKHTVHSVDFRGFGDRTSEQTTGDPIDFCTKELFEEIQDQRDLVFIAHSMGSVVALVLAKQMQKEVKAIVIIEGNLIAEDCGKLSRQFAQEESDDKLIALKADLIQKWSNSEYKGWQDWSKDIFKVMPDTLRKYSRSLVNKSDSGELLVKFRDLNCRKIYLHGDEYVGHPAIDHLEGISVHYIENSGHFVMTDKPRECFQAIVSMVSSA